MICELTELLEELDHAIESTAAIGYAQEVRKLARVASLSSMEGPFYRCTLFL